MPVAEGISRVKLIPAAAVPLALGKQLTEGMSRIGARVMENAVVTCPKASGRLASAHYMLVGTDASGHVTVQVGANPVDPRYPENGSYAAAVHNGTAAHEIRPRRAAALAFRKNGQTIITQLVHHPGTRPQPWLWTATTRVIRMISGSSEQLVGSASALGETVV